MPVLLTRNRRIHSYAGSPSWNCAVIEYSMQQRKSIDQANRKLTQIRTKELEAFDCPAEESAPTLDDRA